MSLSSFSLDNVSRRNTMIYPNNQITSVNRQLASYLTLCFMACQIALNLVGPIILINDGTKRNKKGRSNGSE